MGKKKNAQRHSYDFSLLQPNPFISQRKVYVKKEAKQFKSKKKTEILMTNADYASKR